MNIPEWTATPINDISAIVNDCRENYEKGITQPLSYRRQQLVRFYDMVNENQELIIEALKRDLGKPRAESSLELTAFLSDIVEHLNHLDEWAGDRKVSAGFPFNLDTNLIHPEPLGVVCNIAPWNYPFVLSIGPMVAIIAAGNACVLKPSEMAPASASVMQYLINKYLDNRVYRIIQGGVPETTKLLEHQFDHILYTGNGMVAKIVMAAASKYLCPVTLELGGQCPVFIDSNCDVDTAARRVAWGKFMNAGQTCIAPNHVFVHRSKYDEFLSAIAKHIKLFYGDDAQKSDSYGRIINANHHRRLMKMLDSQVASGKGKIYCGGENDEKEKYIAPTVIALDSPNDQPVMSSEIFGPLLPVMPYDNVDEAIRWVKSHDHPLAAYSFSWDNKFNEKIRTQVHSGGYVANDVVMHFVDTALPFGGVGPSGMGAYHGKQGFDTFSHLKSCLLRNLGMEKVNDLRVPPYSDEKTGWMSWMLGKKFDRNKALNGGGSWFTSPLVWVAAAAGAYFYKKRA